jgi:hypothetical protein
MLLRPILPSKVEAVPGGRHQEELLPIRVLQVAENKAVVSVRGLLQEVRTNVALKPGQAFYVRQEQGEGEVLWRIVREIEGLEFRSPAAVLQDLGIAENPENLAILAALRDAGLTLSKENFFLVKRCLAQLGSFNSVNLLVSLTLARLRVGFQPLLLQALLEFFQKKFSEKLPSEQGINRESLLEKLVVQLQFSAERLRNILLSLYHYFSCSSRKSGEPEAFARIFHEGFLSRDLELLGGQIFAWASCQEQEDPLYFVPFFVFAEQGFGYRGEAYLYPPKEGKDREFWKVMLVFETGNLGWIQVELVMRDSLIEGKVVVEEEETRLLFEEYHQELVQSFQSAGIPFKWVGCACGRVRKLVVQLPGEVVPGFRKYPVVNLLV